MKIRVSKGYAGQRRDVEIQADGTMSLEQFEKIRKEMHTERLELCNVEGTPDRVRVMDGKYLVTELVKE